MTACVSVLLPKVRRLLVELLLWASRTVLQWLSVFVCLSTVWTVVGVLVFRIRVGSILILSSG